MIQQHWRYTQREMIQQLVWTTCRNLSSKFNSIIECTNNFKFILQVKVQLTTFKWVTRGNKMVTKWNKNFASLLHKHGKFFILHALLSVQLRYPKHSKNGSLQHMQLYLPAPPPPLDQLEAAAARLSWMLSCLVSFERREDCLWIRSLLCFTFWSSWISSSILAVLRALSTKE